MSLINILVFVIARLLYNTLLIYKRLLLLVRNVDRHSVHILMMSSNEHYLITVFL